MIRARHTAEGSPPRRALGLSVPTVLQLLWGAACDVSPPTLGDNLRGALGPSLESVMVRIFAFISSLVAGTVMGVIVGLAARAIGRPRRA